MTACRSWTPSPAPGVVVPLAGPANRQGRIAADHIAGRSSAYRSTQGTAVVKAFEVTAGGTGANEKTLRRTGIDYRVVYVHPNGHAGYYPGTAAMHLKLIFATGDGRILGAQVVGRDGVDKRIDVLAVALRAGMTVFDLEELELAYAPPYGSAKDPVNMAGFQAANLLRGDVAFWYPQDWPALPADAQVVDVRTPAEHAHCALPGSVNIPLQLLRSRLDELDPGRPVRLYCASGFRSYLSYRILVQRGLCRRVHLVRGDDDASIGRSRPVPAVGWARAPPRTSGFACGGHGGVPVGRARFRSRRDGGRRRSRDRAKPCWSRVIKTTSLALADRPHARHSGN